MISAKVVADSVSEYGNRIVTLQLNYPRFIHSEFMTHRVFSRNAASSRAIPVKKMIEQIHNDPARPVFWGKNQSGMQAREELSSDALLAAHQTWMNARLSAIKYAEELVSVGAHKQIVNRLLEPWQEMQTVVTATEWDNFYNLRRHPDAQPEIKALADEMWTAMQKSTPKLLQFAEWHLPYVHADTATQRALDQMKKWSTARCARVSYLNHDKTTPDTDKDVLLHDNLLDSGHFSPFEHQATPMYVNKFYANFRGWQSYRHQLGF